jgi:hypothetical protein
MAGPGLQLENSFRLALPWPGQQLVVERYAAEAGECVLDLLANTLRFAEHLPGQNLTTRKAADVTAPLLPHSLPIMLLSVTN